MVTVQAPAVRAHAIEPDRLFETCGLETTGRSARNGVHVGGVGVGVVAANQSRAEEKKKLLLFLTEHRPNDLTTTILCVFYCDFVRVIMKMLTRFRSREKSQKR